MSKVSQWTGTCNERPNQHQVDDLFWQADEAERWEEARASAAWEVAETEWFGEVTATPTAQHDERKELDEVEEREKAIARELGWLWARERALTRELGKLLIRHRS